MHSPPPLLVGGKLPPNVPAPRESLGPENCTPEMSDTGDREGSQRFLGLSAGEDKVPHKLARRGSALLVLKERASKARKRTTATCGTPSRWVAWRRLTDQRRPCSLLEKGS